MIEDPDHIALGTASPGKLFGIAGLGIAALGAGTVDIDETNRPLVVVGVRSDCGSGTPSGKPHFTHESACPAEGDVHRGGAAEVADAVGSGVVGAAVLACGSVAVGAVTVVGGGATLVFACMRSSCSLAVARSNFAGSGS